MTTIQLYPPGKLLHLIEEEENVIIRWIKHEFVKEIQLTSTMLKDHVPIVVKNVLKKVEELNAKS